MSILGSGALDACSQIKLCSVITTDVSTQVEKIIKSWQWGSERTELAQHTVTFQRACSNKYSVYSWFKCALSSLELWSQCSRLLTPSDNCHNGANIPKKIQCDLHWKEGEWTVSSLRCMSWSCEPPPPPTSRTVQYTSNHLSPKLPVKSTQDTSTQTSKVDNLSNNHGFGLHSAQVSMHTKEKLHFTEAFSASSR